MTLALAAGVGEGLGSGPGSSEAQPKAKSPKATSPAAVRRVETEANRNVVRAMHSPCAGAQKPLS